MKRTLPFLISATCIWATATISAKAQKLNQLQPGFSFTRNGDMLTARSASGQQVTVDLSRPVFKGKVIAFTYSDKKKKISREPEKAVSSFTAFPNPASGVVNLTLNGPWSFPAEALIYDKSGNIAKKISLETAEVPLNIASLPEGTYIIRLQAQDTVATQELIVH